MTISINNQYPQIRISRLYLRKKIRVLLKLAGNFKACVDMTFVSDREIAKLNARFLGKKYATDVLSFPSAYSPSLEGRGPGGGWPAGSKRRKNNQFLGDIVISSQTALRQAHEERRPLREQILILIVHGLLHLLGYDHVKKRDMVRMQKKEGEWLGQVLNQQGVQGLIGSP